MMDEALICSDFRDAIDPASQVRIICELHMISEEIALRVLKKNGFSPPSMMDIELGEAIPITSTQKIFMEEARSKSRLTYSDQRHCAF